MNLNLDQLTDEQLRDAEQGVADQKREREYVKWDKELVGRYFRIIRTPTGSSPSPIMRFVGDDYVTLEESLAVGGQNRFVYADVVYLHIQQRDDNQLTCSGFEISHGNRKEFYLKIQPVFYCYGDFRNYLGQWNRAGPTKHFDEVSKEEYVEALGKAVSSAIAEVEDEV